MAVRPFALALDRVVQNLAGYFADEHAANIDPHAYDLKSEILEALITNKSLNDDYLVNLVDDRPRELYCINSRLALPMLDFYNFRALDCVS